MSNAWFYYIFPLALCTVFFIAGLSLFRRFARGDRDGNGKKHGGDAAMGGILFMAIGGTLGLAIVLTSPPPWRRQQMFDRVFHTPAGHIKRFVVNAGGADKHQPLTPSEVVIEDPAQIRRIAEALQSADDRIFATRKKIKWSAKVQMIMRDGDSLYFTVRSREPGDTLVEVLSRPQGGGWNLGDFRADGFDRVLEDAVQAASAR